MSESAILEALALVGNDERYKSRLAELDKRIKDAEEAERRALKAQKEHDSSKQDADHFVAKRQNELAAAQLEHDTAAKEAAARIELGRQQAAEILKMRQDIERDKAAVGMEAEAVYQREKAVAIRERDVEKLSEAVERERAELKSRHERLRAAMG